MSQAIYRYACSDELHLQVAYRERAAVKRTVKMLIALALLPVNQARAGLDVRIYSHRTPFTPMYNGFKMYYFVNRLSFKDHVSF